MGSVRGVVFAGRIGGMRVRGCMRGDADSVASCWGVVGCGWRGWDV